MKRKHFLHGIALIFLVFIVLGLGSACISMIPETPVELGASYREYLLQPVGNERVIDRVRVVSATGRTCYGGEHRNYPEKMGATYKVYQNKASERHLHEAILDQLLNEAKRKYPSETVNIRNASIAGNHHTNPRLERITGREPSTYYDCSVIYIADVITTEPMPQPVTHSEDFRVPGATRTDIYRRAINWLEDNAGRRRIRIDSENIDRGRITGTVTCAARTDQTYFITSKYTIDVYDAKVEIRFTDTILQRTNAAQERVGSPERIFLQSIANSAQTELVDFSTSLRSYIISR